MKIDDLFVVENGISYPKTNLLRCSEAGSIPFIRPASTQQRTIGGWISREDVPEGNIYPKETLFVSTNGEGSHSYSYVSNFEFAANSDVSILIPKKDMTVQEKLFYAKCITMNRFRFSYGRKPKGTKLKKIDLPNVPKWVKTRRVSTLNLKNFPRFSSHSANESDSTKGNTPLVKLRQLFHVSNGNKLDLNKMKLKKGGIPFIGRTGKNNGVVAEVEMIEGLTPYSAGQITVALGGSVLSSFFQYVPFYTAQNVAVLQPIAEMSCEELLYYCAVIRFNAFRFNACGREANRFLRDILIPSRSQVPKWVADSLSRIVKEIQK